MQKGVVLTEIVMVLDMWGHCRRCRQRWPGGTWQLTGDERLMEPKVGTRQETHANDRKGTNESVICSPDASLKGNSRALLLLFAASCRDHFTQG